MTKIRTDLLVADTRTSIATKLAYKLATKQKETNSLLARISLVQHRLIDVTSYSNELENAVLLSIAGNTTVDSVLQERYTHLTTQIAAAVEARRIYIEACKVTETQVQPILKRVTRELLELEEQASLLSKSIANFAEMRENAAKRFRDAGLSPTEIAAIPVTPASSDLDAWRGSLEQIEKRKRDILAFLDSAPMYEEKLLLASEESNG
ncbi:hypothetical protein [Herbaspirillum sp. NPDC087042]|uniref:hypothetical protein n=1 Tax=Herbaspirillum sp. NPDC087042 TaxID=3364004 RepID=UPI003822307D